jgi:hypothetical protein
VKIRLRKWGTVIVTAATLHGGGDPIQSAVDYLSSHDKAERLISITAPSRSDRSALPPLLLTIRQHESHGNYTAYNPTGCDGAPCGGAYQLHSWYASEWARRAGYPNMPANAATWPPATQDAVALHLYHSTATPGWHWCEFTTYC